MNNPAKILTLFFCITLLVMAIADVNTIRTSKNDGKRYGWMLPITVALCVGGPAIGGYFAGRKDERDAR